MSYGDRITRQDLANMLESLQTAAVKAGVSEAPNWRVDIGSKTYGRAYRLWLSKDDGTGAHYTPAAGSFLGMTAREAFQTMATLREAFWAVASARKD